jgi:hypothetical protein
MPFVIIGSTLFGVLPGMEFVPLAAAETGAIGVLCFARAISITTVGSLGLTRIVVAAMVVMAVSRFVPLAAAQFYVQGVAAIVALWPLAYAIGPGTPEARASRKVGDDGPADGHRLAPNCHAS